MNYNDKITWDNYTKDVDKFDQSDYANIQKNINTFKSREIQEELPPVVYETKDDWQPPKKHFKIEFKKRKSEFAFERKLDLHGMTMQQANATTLRFLNECFADGTRRVIVITGHGDGETSIKREFPHWINDLPCVSEYTAASRTQGGSGAFTVILRKNNSA